MWLVVHCSLYVLKQVVGQFICRVFCVLLRIVQLLICDCFWQGIRANSGGSWRYRTLAKAHESQPNRPNADVLRR